MRSESNSLMSGGLALLADGSPSVNNFVTIVSRISPAGHPDVLLLQARYQPALYNDDLFQDFQLPFPSRLNKAVAKRRAEYLASRVCVRFELNQFGIKNFILANDADRAPIWPQEIVGSLSHSRTCVSLLLAKASARKLLGVDVEEIMRPETAEEMRDMIVSPREAKLLLSSGLPFASALTAAFSLKESLYKALFPPFRQFMNFSEAEIIACDATMSSVTLRLTRALSPAFPVGRLFTGHVQLEENRLITWIVAPQA
ncbi:4'-phosphopantetheinyl transferase [Kalamiella sp. sgz302252]|uniref:4'-phosphopantetheinyl transferase family protein n=1 Tax=Pantoea sp. sgz302252 TaxID=3341827 RepID=UPI0036D423C2